MNQETVRPGKNTADPPVSRDTLPPDKTGGGLKDAAGILRTPQVPILCYHQIRDWKPSDSKTARDYIVPVDRFREQMKLLADSGYHSISADQLYNYLTRGASLPPKPVMLTFDDTDLDQFEIAWPEMKKYGFHGMFFIMTVSLGRPHYMSPAQVKELALAGNDIGSHTWDHHNVKKYAGRDWVIQIDKPLAQLQEITGKPIKYFAYPFGLWNQQAIPELKKRGFKAAFQLSEKRDEQEPLFTIRRMIVPGSWTAGQMLNVMKNSFR
ncbi:MAG TPA: polysaccharide deacetylase family protein [Chitinophagaceae bacterium]|nr:polysaccharide deacetylase family protein [Chitinophagaceae bacterium]